MTTTIISDDNPRLLLVQPVDSHDLEELDTEVAYIRANTDVPFRLVAVHIRKWNEELTPWPAPPVFGKIPFGEGAEKTLREILQIVEEQQQRLGWKVDPSAPLEKVILGGYSLAGLFALWAGTQEAFGGIVAASPSVWYRDWLSYATTHPSPAAHVYLSLGDREHRSKTPIMATVNDCINRQRDLLVTQGVDAVLEMNPGNHFQDNGVRTAKGFVWAMNRIQAANQKDSCDQSTEFVSPLK